MKYLMATFGLMCAFVMGSVSVVYAENLETDLGSSLEPTVQTIEGTVEQMDGSLLVVAEYITNYRGEEIKDKEMHVRLSSDTKLIHGSKRVGDAVRIDVTRGWVANSIE